MNPLDMEWPNFAGVPGDEILANLSRPASQELARFVWIDGELREAEQVKIHYYANALHYGTAVFEGIRVYPTRRAPRSLGFGATWSV
jgi:hypothetical protein